MSGNHLTCFQGQTCSLWLEQINLRMFSSCFFEAVWSFFLVFFFFEGTNAAHRNLETLTSRRELPKRHLKRYSEGMMQWMPSRSSAAKSLLFSSFKVS